MSEPGPKETGAMPAAGGAEADEFAHIPASRTRHPALAIGAIALAGYLIVHQRADISYALSSGEARNLGDARSLFAGGGEPPANRYVRIAGTPDRQSALHVDTKGSWKFSQMFRILGTGDHLFLHRKQGVLPTDRVLKDVFAGRLVRLSQLPYDDSIRRHYAERVSATHFFRKQDLAKVAGQNGATLTDLAGDPVVITAGEVLAIDVLRPDHYEIAVPKERIADEAGARAEIEKRGGTVVATTKNGPVKANAFIVRVDRDDREATLGDLADIDSRVWIRAARDSHRVRLGEIAVDGQELVLRAGKAGGADARATMADVVSIRTLAPIRIPEHAFILLEDDVPRGHVASVLISVALLGFAIVNILGLRQGLRRAKA